MSADTGPPPAVSLSAVTKRFEGVTAVEDLTLEVADGALFGLLGPNGAGKTTVLRLIVNIYEPDRGVIRVFGRPAAQASRSTLGYLPEERGLYRKMGVLEQLVFFGRLKGLSRERARARAGEWLGRMGLTGWQGRRLEDLSKGMQQKVQFVSAVLHDPRLVILDEPFSGLDPLNVQLFLEVMRELRGAGKTILLSTHRLEQAERLVTDICLIHGSRAVLAGDLGRVKRELGHGRVLLDWSGDPAELADPELVVAHRSTPDGEEFALRDGASPQALLRRAVERGEVRRFQLLEPSLRDIYLERLGGRTDGPGAAEPRPEERT